MALESAALAIFSLLNIFSVAILIYVRRKYRKPKKFEYKIPKDQYNYFMDMSNLVEPLARLELMVAEFGPKYLVGINHGGVAIASFIAERVGIDQENLYGLVINNGTSNRKFQFIQKEGFSGPDFMNDSIAIIDDVVRSGETVKKLRSHFAEQLKENPNIRIYTLVAHIDSVELLDGYGVETRNPDLIFPWSGEKRIEATLSNNDGPHASYRNLINIDITKKDLDGVVSKMRRKEI